MMASALALDLGAGDEERAAELDHRRPEVHAVERVGGGEPAERLGDGDGSVEDDDALRAGDERADPVGGERGRGSL